MIAERESKQNRENQPVFILTVVTVAELCWTQVLHQNRPKALVKRFHLWSVMGLWNTFTLCGCEALFTLNSQNQTLTTLLKFKTFIREHLKTEPAGEAVSCWVDRFPSPSPWKPFLRAADTCSPVCMSGLV